MKYDNVCLVCLRTDRYLKRIHKKLSNFHYELCEINVDNVDAQYCYECRHLIKKLYNFKQKCLQSATLLNNYDIKLQNTPLDKLYKLLPPSNIGIKNNKNNFVYVLEHFTPNDDISITSHGTLVPALEHYSNTIDKTHASQNHTATYDEMQPSQNYTASYEEQQTPDNYTAPYNEIQAPEIYTAPYEEIQAPENYTATNKETDTEIKIEDSDFDAVVVIKDVEPVEPLIVSADATNSSCTLRRLENLNTSLTFESDDKASGILNNNLLVIKEKEFNDNTEIKIKECDNLSDDERTISVFGDCDEAAAVFDVKEGTAECSYYNIRRDTGDFGIDNRKIINKNGTNNHGINSNSDKQVFNINIEYANNGTNILYNSLTNVDQPLFRISDAYSLKDNEDMNKNSCNKRFLMNKSKATERNDVGTNFTIPQLYNKNKTSRDATKRNAERKSRSTNTQVYRKNVKKNGTSLNTDMTLTEDNDLVQQSTDVRTDAAFKCDLCAFETVFIDSLLKHMEIIHNAGPFYCDLHDYNCCKKHQSMNNLRTYYTNVKRFACNLCDYKSKRKHQMTDHIIRKHRKEKPYSCGYCSYRSKNKYDLAAHVERHTHVSTLHRCDHCTYRSRSKNDLSMHVRRRHTREMPFACELCSFSTTSQAYLAKHRKTHTRERTNDNLYACTHCQYKCQQKHVLFYHMRGHSIKQLYQCDHCDFICTQKKKMMVHIKTHANLFPIKESNKAAKPDKASRLVTDELIATESRDTSETNTTIQLDKSKTTVNDMGTNGEREPKEPNTESTDKLKCDMCEFNTDSTDMLQKHVTIHNYSPIFCDLRNYYCCLKHQAMNHLRPYYANDKRFACNICEHRSTQKPHMINHIQRKHSEERPYSCSHCSHTSKCKYDLAVHAKRHTQDKPFLCGYCKFKCKTESELVAHVRRHIKEKPLACDHCSFRSSSKYYLTKHRRIHTKSNVYICDHCDYKCKQKQMLVYHLRTHTKNNLFVCDHCDFNCTVKEKMVVHVRTHTRPFACKQCDYKSARKDYLLRHVKQSHTKNSNCG